MDDLSIGQRVRQAREQRGWKQEDLAHAAKTTTATISYLETGKKRTKPETLQKVAEVLGMTLSFSLQPAAEPEPERPLPDTKSLLAQLVAAQVRTEERQAEMLAAQAEMSQALMALAHERLESRAEAARTSARISQIEEGLRALLETPRGGCGESEETLAG